MLLKKWGLKKVIAMFLLLCIVLSAASPAVGATFEDDLMVQAEETLTVDGIVYALDSESGTAGVVDCVYSEIYKKGAIVIPASITDEESRVYLVTSIAESAFHRLNGGDRLSLQLPEGLLSIGAGAFESVRIEGEVIIPDSVTFMGERAFNGIGFIEDVTPLSIGAGISVIPSMAFANVWGFVTLELSAGIEQIAEDAFKGSDTFREIIVTGEEGCLDDLIAQNPDLSKVKKVTYIVPPDPTDLSAATLQAQIDAAEDERTTEIALTGNVYLEQHIRIPAGKDIVLTDDGIARTVSSARGTMLEELFVVEKGGKLTIDTTAGDEMLMLQGGKAKGSDQGSIVNVKGIFCLKSGTLRGGTVSGSRSGAIRVDKGATFEMTGGVLEKTELTNPNGTLTAAVVVVSGARFDMSGGSIRDNISEAYQVDAGGGVIVYGWNKHDPTGVMTLSGTARIENNYAYNGAGVYLCGNAELTMTGGAITDNEAARFGGGICVAGRTGGMTADVDALCKLTMQGGSISNNTADTGGGIYLNSNYVSLEAGYIENNTAYTQGGGVYISEVPYLLHIYNALITGNMAETMGGGMWFCPTGDAVLAVTNGAAVYGNTVAAGGAGDDFVSVGGYKREVTLADRILGGGSVAWYNDGAVIGNVDDPNIPPVNFVGTVDENVPRFDPETPGERVHIQASTGSAALKAIVSEEAQALAESQAKLLIRNNQARRGGGIGSNGAIIAGVIDREYTLTVEKTWLDTPDIRLPEALTVYLRVGEYRLDAVTLYAENDWTASFTGLPDPDTLTGEGLSYAVVEQPVPNNFEVAYQPAAIDPENRVITIAVSNTYHEPYIPPVVPVEPEKPEEPVTPPKDPDVDITDPDTPTTDMEMEDPETLPPDIPETGDTAPIWLYIMTMGASLLCIIYISFGKRTKKSR